MKEADVTVTHPNLAVVEPQAQIWTNASGVYKGNFFGNRSCVLLWL